MSMTMNAPMKAPGPAPRLQAENLHLSHGSRCALRGVSTSIGPGWTAIVGPNGAGKSSLLRVLAGLQRPQQGRVQLDGVDVNSMGAAQRGQRIAWLAQMGETSGDLTVRETVALGRLPHTGVFGALSARDEAAVDRAMQLTECAAWAERRLAELSGGERQRALLARALATDAPVLLLDEPVAHLDPPHQVAVARLARQLAGTHTVVTVLHELSYALAADRVLLLDQGCVVADASRDDPGLHGALCRCFADAVHIQAHQGGWVAVPALRA
jgi:iron complex transport system ATP-binding protein